MVGVNNSSKWGRNVELRGTTDPAEEDSESRNNPESIVLGSAAVKRKLSGKNQGEESSRSGY